MISLLYELCLYALTGAQLNEGIEIGVQGDYKLCKLRLDKTALGGALGSIHTDPGSIRLCIH